MAENSLYKKGLKNIMTTPDSIQKFHVKKLHNLPKLKNNKILISWISFEALNSKMYFFQYVLSTIIPHTTN